MQVAVFERDKATVISLDNLAQMIRQGDYERLFRAGGVAIVRWLDQERTARDSETFVGLVCHAYKEEAFAKVREVEIAYGGLADTNQKSWFRARQF